VQPRRRTAGARRIADEAPVTASLDHGRQRSSRREDGERLTAIAQRAPSTS